MKKNQLLISLLIVILLSLLNLYAQNQHSNQSRGFSANGVYSSHDIDHINLFNGNLTIPIPIGQKYVVGGALSYQLTLVYNSYLWSQREACTSIVNFDTNYHTSYFITNYQAGRGGGLEIPTIANALDPYDPGTSRGSSDGCYTIEYPNPAANAGMGWQLTFGRLYNPLQDVPSAADLPMTTEKHTHVFQSADGSEHTFYTTLHEGETKTPNIFYTRDGSYLRMKKFSDTSYEIEFPNGVIYTFGSAPNGQPGGTELRVTAMRDQFNNWVSIAYSATRWTISDSVGRTHTVNLAPQDTSTAPLGDDAPQIEYQNVITSVSLEDFSETGARTYANYGFTYYSTTIERALPKLLEVFNGIKPKVFVPFLTSVKLPDGSKYSMPENADGSRAASYDYTGEYSSKKAIGVLRRMELPTGGSIEWQYKDASDPDPITHSYNFPIAASARNYHRSSTGVRKRIVSEGGRQYVWKYIPNAVRVPDSGTGGENCTFPSTAWFTAACAPRLFTNTVISPNPDRKQSGVSEDGFETVYYFSVYPHPWDTNGRSVYDWHVSEYGLPMNKDVWLLDSTNRPLFLSTQTFNLDGSLKRSTYVRYETDQFPASDGFGNVVETNARVEASRTVYNDDCGKLSTSDCSPNNAATKYTEVQYSDFDGVGNYRQTRTFGNLGNNNRTVITNYNPGTGTYNVNLATNTRDTSFVYSPPSTGKSWILGTYDRIISSETGKRSAAYFKFGSKGELSAKRTAKNIEADNINYSVTRPDDLPITLSSSDVLVNYVYDSSGNLSTESYFGGDKQQVLNSLSGSNFPSTTIFPSLSDAASEYKATYGYQCKWPNNTTGVSGIPSTKSYRTNGEVSFKSLDDTIDCSTGLARSSRDNAGVETKYGFDELGRLRTVIRQQGVSDNVTYDQAINGSLPKVTVQHREKGTLNVLAEEIYIYDALGRLITEKKRQPGGIYQARDTNYNGLNWVTDVSEWKKEGQTSDNKKTVYDDFDPFGRARLTYLPDKKIVKMDYKGARIVSRTIGIASQINGSGGITEQESTTSEIYDTQGRLIQLQDPAGVSGQLVTWIYGYNVNNKLVSASASDSGSGTSQYRTFGYDNLGNLLSRSIPEVPQSSYTGYDTMGNVGESNDGAHRLNYKYDSYQRVKEVKELDGSTQGRILKEFTYDTAAGFGIGKPAKATRYNYVTNPYAPATPAGNPVNVALQSGTTVVASSTNSSGPSAFSPQNVINGSRSGYQWFVNGGWNDNTQNSFPDWVEVRFNGTKKISEVNVFSMQDNYTNPVEPTIDQTFSLYGLVDFQVQYWNGSVWTTVPGGNIVGNNKVWRKVTLASPVTTDKIRIYVTRAADMWTRITEIEAIEYPAGSQPDPTEYKVGISEEYSYAGIDGRMSKTVTRLNSLNPQGPSFEQSFEYDQLGNIKLQTYPQCTNANCVSPNNQSRPWQVHYNYNQGWLTSVGAGDNYIYNNYAGAITYNDNGTVNTIAHGNGVTDTWTQDPNNMQRTARIFSKRGNAYIWDSGAGDPYTNGVPSADYNYKYDSAGNITKIGRDWYLYDQVNRVKEGSVMAVGSKKSYNYDGYGNILSITQYTGVTTPTNGLSSAPFVSGTKSEKNQLTLNYDGAGNALGLLGANGQPNPVPIYTYDALNMIKYVPGFIYLYGPDDERDWVIDRRNPNSISEKITLRGLNNEVLREYQVTGGDGPGHYSWMKDYIYAGSKLLLSESPSGIRHYHLDHLGTTKAITDAGGNLINGQVYQYFPFGDEATAEPPSDETLRFTGHERDVNDPFRLDYMHARFYFRGGGQGKFMSVDPGNDIDAKHPQSWNLYSYARNNPIRLFDQNGMASQDSMSTLVVNVYMIHSNLNGNIKQINEQGLAKARNFFSQAGIAFNVKRYEGSLSLEAGRVNGTVTTAQGKTNFGDFIKAKAGTGIFLIVDGSLPITGATDSHLHVSFVGIRSDGATISDEFAHSLGNISSLWNKGGILGNLLLNVYDDLKMDAQELNVSLGSGIHPKFQETIRQGAQEVGCTAGQSGCGK